MPHLALSCFGAFQANLDGERLTTFHSVKVQALHAYLALEADRPHPRETLAALLWPLDAETSARNSLRQALYELRKLLGDRDDLDTPFLLVTRQSVQFNLNSDYTLDVADFLSAFKQGQLEQATALYRGELLSGLTCESEPFEEWLRQQRAYFHNLAIDVYFRLTDQAFHQGDLAQARTYAQRQLALEPWREEAHRQVMMALALSGERSAALAQYETCRRTLADELRVEPATETTTLYEQIRTGELAGKRAPSPVTPSDFAPAAPVPTPARCHNLPPQPTPFIGRAADLTQITECLDDPTCRLLTIVGPGGMGKTRLAIQAVQNMGELASLADKPPFTDGIYFVALAGVASPDLLVSTIAAALDFTFYGTGEPQQQLLAYLQKRSLLLLLDNCEHLLDGIDLVSDLLGAAPQVKVVATSREPLNLREEWLHPLSGMSFPGDEGDAKRGTVTDLAAYTAIQLFAQCARRMKPSFDLVAEGTAVIRICRLVNGMPLGIELASSWLKHFSCEQIASEVEHSLDFLATTLRNVSARHRSIRAVFEHSWHLLSAAEQQVLQRIAIFRGGFRLEAAQQVAAATFPLLISLAEKSLVQPTPSGRYQMHELLRQFAEEKLQALLHEWVAVQERHAHYYLLFLQQHAAALEGRQMAATVTIIEAEIENIRLAWQWALRHKNVDAMGLGLDGLHLFFWMRHWYQEGEALFAQTANMLASEQLVGKQRLFLGRCLAMEAHLLILLYIEVGRSHGKEQVELLCQQSLAILQPPNATAEIGLVLLALGDYYKDVGKVALALSVQEQALAALDTQGNTLPLRRALHDVGHAHFWLGHYEVSMNHFRRCIVLCEERGDLKTLGDAFDMVGMVHQARGDYSAARQAEEAALNARTMADDKRGIGWSLQLLGEIAWHTEDYTIAQQRSLDSLAIFTEIGTPRQGHAALNTLGNVAWSLGDYPEARRYFRTVLTPLTRAGHLPLTWTDIVALTGLGAVLWKEGQSQQAVELLIYAHRHPVGLQETKDRAAAFLAELAASLPAEQFAAAQQQAETQDLRTFVAELLAEESAVPQSNGGNPCPT